MLRVPVGGGLVPAGVLHTVLPGSQVPIYFIAERHLFDRPEIYGYPDDAYRFAFFSRAALDLMVGAWGWRPDVVSVHDWHAAPAIAWLATAGQLDERYRGAADVPDHPQPGAPGPGQPPGAGLPGHRRAAADRGSAPAR